MLLAGCVLMVSVRAQGNVEPVILRASALHREAVNLSETCHFLCALYTGV